MAAAATKSTIKLIIFSLIFLEIFVSPTDQTKDLFSISDLPLTAKARRLQNEVAEPQINEDDKNGVARIEEQLAKARGRIHKAIVEKSVGLNGSVYRNRFSFFQSHSEMMKTFKIWTYKEGEIPLMHNGPMKSIYSVEGHFMEEMERSQGNTVVATHPDEAHAFFIPISVANIVHYVYNSEDRPFNFLARIEQILEDYIGVIAERYPYWNRSNGADHFYVSCHDWAPFATRENPKLFTNLIRVLCNANTSEGFNPTRDVSMPEINAPYNSIPTLTPGQPPHNRSIFAFFAGGNHGYVRKKLFQHWGNHQDTDIQVHDYLPKGANYTDLLTHSKFCLCPSGYEVASARATEAIYVGCVPVIIKRSYVLPYSDVLDWNEFSVHVKYDEIQDLKRILEGVSFEKYLDMQRKVMEVQKHFRVNFPARQADVFHMILHSVWLRRLNVRINRL